ncbi:C1 family peptidase [Azospirillum soli]|uniref:C1 family peptidase n=1 Tax=Azospirillum soli TaxID=1304799 RepID=UPI001AE98A8E|nr:C1 family peptidase [Azospirillum soli]MBP2316816.1 hypothetical protein [Azospirillum soli]
MSKAAVIERPSKSKSVKPQTPKQAAPPVRILNGIPSRDTERDWQVAHAEDAGLLRAQAIPPAKDLRETWWTVGDQGSTGSSVGWAVGDSLLRWHLVKAGRAARDARLSPRFIWMAAKDFDEFVTAPTTFIEAESTSLKADLDGALYPGDEKTFYAIASTLKISNCINLDRPASAWRRWLAVNRPILTRLDVEQTWDDATSTGGVLKTYQPMTAHGGHAVALVGYDQERFIVRNSWGTQWGDGGFAYASNAYAAAAFTEAYGVTVA